MYKNMILKHLGEERDLYLKSPFFKKIFDSMRMEEFEEKHLAEAIALLCEQIYNDNKIIIEYVNRYGVALGHAEILTNSKDVCAWYGTPHYNKDVDVRICPIGLNYWKLDYKSEEDNNEHNRSI